MDKEIETPTTPATPAPTSPQTPPQKKEVDLGAILLPKKEVHDPLNAPRAEAGVLLKQEQTAALPKTAAPKVPLPPRNDSIVQPLVTYQSDMQKYIQQNNVSNVTIAAAEAERRGKNPDTRETPGQTGSFWFRLGMIFLGSLLLGGAVGLVGYVVYRSQALPAAVNPQAPVIAIDEVRMVPIATTDSRTTALDKLTQAKDAVALSLGLVAQLQPVSATSTPQTPMSARTLLPILTPAMPQELSRTLLPTFLLGVHAFDRNQPFLILKTDSYEQAFSGMLAWENTMHDDLLPLFAYTPSEPIQMAPVVTATTTNTATTTAATSTSVSTHSTTTQILQPVQAVLPGAFLDKILENHDTRVLQNSNGDIYFLWTFIDRGTILITTNPHTLKEVIVRTHEAPIVPIPGQ